MLVEYRVNINLYIYSRSWYQVQCLTIERLKYLNLEVSTGRIINTKENINIRCRINPSEEHIWHTSNSQLNIIVDLIYNFLISWGKRQDQLDQKFEGIFKEYQKLIEKHSALNNKIDLALHKLEEARAKQNIVCKNNDYIKEEVLSIGRNIVHHSNKNKELPPATEIKQDISDIKNLALEIKNLILS